MDDSRDRVGRAALVALGLLYAHLYLAPISPQSAVAGGDFRHYLASARALLDGRTPYSLEQWDYPPLISFLLVPLAGLREPTAWWVWFGLQHLALAFAALWTIRALGGTLAAAVAVAITWTAGHGIAVSLAEGQINGLLVALICVVLWPPARARWVSAAALATAFALKIWPGALWLADALARRWRRLFGGVAAGLLLVALPLALLVTLFEGPWRPRHPQYWLGTPAFLNGSLPAVALRMRDPPRANQQLPRNWVAGNQTEKLHLRGTDRGVSALVAIGTLAAGSALLLHRARLRQPDASWRLPAAMLALTLVAAPISWPHYSVLQLPGSAALALDLVRRRRRLASTSLAACFLALNWTEAVVVGPYVATYGIVVGNPVLTWTLTTLPAVAGVGLFLLHVLAMPAVADPRSCPSDPER